MSQANLSAKIVLDAEQFTQKMTEVKTQSEKFDAFIQKSTERIKAISPPIAQFADQAQKGLNKASVAAAKFDRAFGEFFDELKDELSPVTTKLEKMGNAAKKGFQTAQQAAQKFGKEFQKLNEKVEAFRGKIPSIGSGLGALGNAAKAGFAAATVAATGFFTLVATKSADAKRILNDATRLNMDTTSMQAFTIAVGKMGIESDKAADILKDVNDKIGDFIVTGGGEAKDIFEKLSLSAQDFIGLSPEKALVKIGAAMDGLTTQDKTFLLESLADDASLLLPLLEKNGAKLNELKKAAIDKGQILSEHELKSLNTFKTTLDDIWGKLSAFGAHLAGYLSEPLNVLLEQFNTLVDSLGGMDKAALAFTRSIVQGLNWAVQFVTELYVKFQELKLAMVDAKGLWAMVSNLSEKKRLKAIAEIEIERTELVGKIENAKSNARTFEADVLRKMENALENAAKNMEKARANGYAATQPKEDTTRSMNEWIKKTQDENAKITKDAANKQNDASEKMRQAAELIKQSEQFAQNGDHDKARETFDKAIALQESAKALLDSAAELRETLTEIKQNNTNTAETQKNVDAIVQNTQAQNQSAAAFQAAATTFQQSVALNNAARQTPVNQSVNVVFSGSVGVNLNGANDNLVKDILNNQNFTQFIQTQIQRGMDTWLRETAKGVL